MVKIEYNDVKIEVPQSWDDVSLGVYEKFHKAKPQTHRERVTQIANICGIDPELLLGWPTEVFNKVVGFASFIFEEDTTAPVSFVEVEGVRYFIAIEDELLLGEYIDADDVQKNSDAVLSNVLAIVCRPAGETYNHRQNEERAAMFAALPVSKVLGVLAFFLHYRQQSEAHTAAYLSLKLAADQSHPSISSLLRRTGGIRLLRIWPIIRYYALTLLLKNQLRKYLLSCNTQKTKASRKTRKRN